jgi:DNA-binding winged helix-turn-helix (wHTH) protein/pimeloyl-ACP methyl ester carboxylesterase
LECGARLGTLRSVIYAFDQYQLDTQRFELREENAVIALEPQVFSVLAFLIERRDRVVSKDELLEGVWGTSFVTDAALSTRIMEARRAVADNGRDQRLIRTIQRRGYRFVGDVRESGETPKTDESAPFDRVSVGRSARFCTTPDGVRIAYALVGEGTPLVKVANWLTHLEVDLESPVWRHLITDLVPKGQFVRYDARGSGLSDRDVEELSLDVWVRDLESVIDELGVDRFPLLGISQGGAVAVRYALAHPERVSHLVLHGAYARGRNFRGPESAEANEALSVLTGQGWGNPESAFSRMFSDRMIPGGTVEQQGWLTELQQVSTSSSNAERFMRAMGDINIEGRLGEVAVPTLVTHSRGDQQVPFEEGRILAAGIPDARLLTLESNNHLILDGEPAWVPFRDEVRAFIAT